MATLNASKTRIPPDAFNRVVFAGERIRIERRGGDAAYLISADDLARLEELEDRYWAAEGKAALRRFEASGQKPVPFEKTKARMRR